MVCHPHASDTFGHEQVQVHIRAAEHFRHGVGHMLVQVVYVFGPGKGLANAHEREAALLPISFERSCRVTLLRGQLMHVLAQS